MQQHPPSLHSFFSAWHELELRYPFGVMRLAPLFAAFGVSDSLCQEIDRDVFLDLMDPSRPNVNLIRVEGRRTSRVTWVCIEPLEYSVVRISLQRSPFATMLCSMEITATPAMLVETLMLFHRWPPCGGCRSRNGLFVETRSERRRRTE